MITVRLGNKEDDVSIFCLFMILDMIKSGSIWQMVVPLRIVLLDVKFIHFFLFFFLNGRQKVSNVFLFSLTIVFLLSCTLIIE